MQRHFTEHYQRAAQAGEDGLGETEPQSFGMNGQRADPAKNASQQDFEEAALCAEEVENPADNLEERCKSLVDDVRLRAAAEMENYKKRLAREHQDQLRYAAESVLGDLLPTLDNLELALQYGSKAEACRDMLQGVAMTHKLLQEVLVRHGLTPQGAEGEAFSPEVHEAVGFESRPELEPGVVARVLQRGYKLGERLLRPAKVMVNQ